MYLINFVHTIKVKLTNTCILNKYHDICLFHASAAVSIYTFQ